MIEVKICGLTNADDLMAAQEGGADYIGFNLYSGSPRCVSGMEICRMLDRVTLVSKAVGIFVNECRDVVEKISADCGLYAVQLHGDEIADDFLEMKPVVWKAVKLRDGICLPALCGWAVERYLLDAAVPGAYGGTGITVDWDDAARIAECNRVMLAGGLTPDNVAEGVRRVRPAGVDVASGVERSPGRKDYDLVRKFIEAAKNAITT